MTLFTKMSFDELLTSVYADGYERERETERERSCKEHKMFQLKVAPF